MADSLRQKMFEELREKDIFRQAQAHAFDYLDDALARRVFPNEEGIANLEAFAEDLPEAGAMPARSSNASTNTALRRRSPRSAGDTSDS